MIFQQPTKADFNRWKAQARRYKPLLLPHRKSGGEVLDYLKSRYPLTELTDPDVLSVISDNVTETPYWAEKLPAGARPDPRAFYLENEGEGAAFYRPENQDSAQVWGGEILRIFVGIDLSSGFYMVEGSSLLWDELCAFQGLDEKDLNHYVVTAQYINALERTGRLDQVILDRCAAWHEAEEYQKIIDGLEALRPEERSPELDSELARAYNNRAAPSDRAAYEKALSLLAPHEAHFQGDYFWNFRMGYSYYYLDQEAEALRYFEQALKARPEDPDTQEMMNRCRQCLALPRYQKNFRQRVAEAWEAFEAIEGEVLDIMDADQDHTQESRLVRKCAAAFQPAFDSLSFELSFDGERYQLILSADGSLAKLFPLVYFQRRAPASVLESWDILVGCPPMEDYTMDCDGAEISAGDVLVWAEKQGDHQINLTLYCEKLLPLMEQNPNQALWMLSALTGRVLGEVSFIALVNEFSAAEEPEAEPAFSLADLPQAVEEMGLTLYEDAARLLEERALTYQPDPVRDRDADWRLDTYAGSTRLPALLGEYLSGESETIEELHNLGAAAGFLFFPTENFPEEDRAGRALKLRGELEKVLLRQAGEDAVTFLGGALGLYCGYLDFIAWDLDAVLNAARDFFETTELPWAGFHSFFRDVGSVRLLNREPEPDTPPEVHPETGSLLSPEDIQTLEGFCEESTGYFYAMLDHLQTLIQNRAAEGRFTEKQARQDLQIALWYGYACLNIDEYPYYYRAVEQMKDAEGNARGCGVWYYRYSVALTYCSRLDEALDYAERGAREEPSYPWIWLQLGKLRSHFGDKAGALDAVARGLELEPEDYEFLTLGEEIRAGATLEQMEYHWINPDFDQDLQQGLGEDVEAKKLAIACIRPDPEGLARFFAIFRPDPAEYQKDSPYCVFPYPVQGRPVDLVFRMNEAGLSKLNEAWLRTQKARLDSGLWLTQTAENGEPGQLDTVLLDQNGAVTLLYRLPGKEERYFHLLVDEDGAPVPPEKAPDAPEER